MVLGGQRLAPLGEEAGQLPGFLVVAGPLDGLLRLAQFGLIFLIRVVLAPGTQRLERARCALAAVHARRSEEDDGVLDALFLEAPERLQVLGKHPDGAGLGALEELRIQIRERLLRHIFATLADVMIALFLERGPMRASRTAFRLSVVLSATLTLGVAATQAPPPQPAAAPSLHARGVRRLVIKNAMVIYGSGRPPFGPVDIGVEDGRISYIGSPAGRFTSGADAVIDATGKYVMPGIVNTHMHWHEERQPGIPQPIQYERNLYLAAGVTTAREVGGDFDKSKRWQAESNAHTIISPRILVYPVVNKGRIGSPDEIRTWVREIHQRGADGLKLIALDRDQVEAALTEAKRLGLRTTTHIGVEETTAADYIELGVSSIEHFYGVADAALPGVQNFPPDMNYNDEVHRFGRAGRAVRAGRSRKAPPGDRPDGGEARRLESDVLDL